MDSPHPDTQGISARILICAHRILKLDVSVNTLTQTLNYALYVDILTLMLNIGEPGLVPYPQDDMDRYRSTGLWRGRSLPADLQESAALHAESIALITPEGRWSYDDLFERARKFGAGLMEATDLLPGDPVMFQMGNVAETVVAYLGCLLAGMRPVCTLPQHGEREISLLAEHVGAKGLIVQADYNEGGPLATARAVVDRGVIDVVIVARGSTDGIEANLVVPFADVLTAGAGVELPQVSHEQIAVYQLSGGTTGLPKVAARLHEEYSYNSRAWARECGWGSDTRILYPLPIMHNAGIALALQPALLTGASIVLAPDARIDTILDLVESERPSCLPLVPPAVAIRLLDEPRSRAVDLTCIIDFIVGGQYLPVEVSERLRNDLGIEVRQMFGMAEGMFLLTPHDADEEVRFHTVGSPVSPADEVRILEVAGDDVVEEGSVGEFCARGPYTIRGYFRADQHNADSFTADGFYRTGDLARAHRYGGRVTYSIEGRIKDVINRGVEKIHAEEVEEIIVRHPGVQDAAVVAMPDPVLGEKACAFLVLEDRDSELGVPQLGEFLLGEGLAKYKLPERVELIDALPLSNVGKVSKKTLRERVAAELRIDMHG